MNETTAAMFHERVVAGAMNKEQESRVHLEEDICIHIFTVSAAMVGVCLTVIGLLRVVIAVRQRDTLADDLLAGDAVLFGASCLLSYFSLRRRTVRRRPTLEKLADAIFIAALLVMVTVCVYITYAIALT